MASRLGVELTLVIAGVGCFIVYHVWLIFIKGKGPRAAHEFDDFFGAGKLARVVFAEAVMSDEKEAITAVQTIRNAIMACTFVSTIAAVICVALVNALLDPMKIERIRKLNETDIIASKAEGDPVFGPNIILAAPIATLCASCLCTAHSVRLYVHLGFYIRAVSSKFNRNLLRREEAMAIALKAGLAFTVGLRVLYFFIPLVLWVFGPTVLCASGLLLTAVLFHLDRFRRDEPHELLQHAASLSMDRELGCSTQLPPPHQAPVETAVVVVDAGSTAVSGSAVRERAAAIQQALD